LLKLAAVFAARPRVEIWKPYLDGNGTRDAALRALVQRTGTSGSG
jgi:hypothetical protein